MVYIIFHNQTDAMRCRNKLAADHIDGTVVKSPSLMSGGSCAWAVRINEELRDRAGQICVAEDIHPCAWHFDQRGGRR